MITLGIETSCDETALALIETREVANKSGGFDVECRVIDSLVHSQADLHSAYGGVYPSLAKREHSKNLIPLLHKLLEATQDPNSPQIILDDAKFTEIFNSFRTSFEAQNADLWQSFTGADFLRKIPRIDRIAVTEGPGLEPTLWVGISFARILGALWNVPIVPVNHMEGHIVGSLLSSDEPTGTWQRLKSIDFPALALLISGGHTELVDIQRKHETDTRYSYTILGQTLDDAVGEAFDKVARLLKLPYPGGPHISRLSEEAAAMLTPSPLRLPRPMMKSGDLNFSFSGLKTAVLYATRAATQADGSMTDEFRRGLAHEFELAVAETLEYKLRSAIDQIGARTLIIGGGVSANLMLRERFTKIALEYNIPIYLPSRHISGDNALMIALAGAIDTTKHDDVSGMLLKADGTKKLGVQNIE